MGTRFLYDSSSPNTRSRPVGSIFYPFAPRPPTLPFSPPPPPPPPPPPSISGSPPTPSPSSSTSSKPPSRANSNTPPTQLPPPPSFASASRSTPAPSSFSSAGLFAGIAVIAVAILLVFSVFGISYWKNKKRRRNDGKGPKGINAIGFSKSAAFTYEELARATDGFSDANLLGQGGFGYVHRGLLPNGKKVAVKQLKAGSGQGEREFRAEAEILSRVHHKHLVSLVGYCITGTHRLLVYEFVPNNTLEFHLHGQGPTLDWPTRMRIALGVAKGLAYLHEDCRPNIIHRDIKAANILLDLEFEAKVADFGLAKFCPDIYTHVSTRVMGTFGYLAPEYALSGKLTEKADIFSFGVMLLELITGHRPLGSHHTFMEGSLVEWAMPLLTRALEEENFNSLVDPKLPSQYEPNEMAPMVQCAAASIRYSAKCRPSMSQIVRALEGEASLVAKYTSIGSSDYDTAQYKEDMKMFRKMVLLGTRQSGGKQ